MDRAVLARALAHRPLWLEQNRSIALDTALDTLVNDVNDVSDVSGLS